jgi:hypothetical protein
MMNEKNTEIMNFFLEERFQLKSYISFLFKQLSEDNLDQTDIKEIVSK